jgi:hypothetical protein
MLVMRDDSFILFFVVGFAATDIAKVCDGCVEIKIADFLKDGTQICYGTVPGFSCLVSPISLEFF